MSSNIQPEKRDYIKNPTFKLWVANNFPFIEADFDATTNYQLLCKVVEYLNRNIENMNIQEENTEALYNAFMELQDYVNTYFDTELPELVNNKLDSMAQDGTLEALISKYIDNNLKRVYNSLELLKVADLPENIKVETLGYYSINDGGGATYIIRNIQPSSYYETLDNGKFAELVEINQYPEMFGAYGDGEHDDTTAFTKLINNNDIINLNTKKIYKITNLTINKNLTINGNNATIKGTSGNHLIEMTTSTTNKVLTINNLSINALNYSVGIYINKNRLVCNYLTVSNATDIDIYIVKTGSYGLCELHEVTCNLSNVGLQITASDCKIDNFHGYNCMTHIKNRGGLTHINSCHGWNYNTANKDWITGSTLIDTNSSIVGSDIYIDTLENGIVLPTGYQYVSIILQNVSYFINTSSYPSTQQDPTLLKNVENFQGYCKIDGVFADENGWTNSQGQYPTLIGNVYNPRIVLTNVGNSGFTFERYKPIETNEDINTSSYTIQVDTYVSYNRRKVKYKDYNIHIDLVGNMKTSCPNNTIISQLTFTGQNLQYLNERTRVQAYYKDTSTHGRVYNLPAYIDNNHQLSVYNNTGIALGSAGYYGELHILIDDIHQN